MIPMFPTVRGREEEQVQTVVGPFHWIVLDFVLPIRARINKRLAKINASVSEPHEEMPHYARRPRNIWNWFFE
jgi:hypothetical protein